jgi:PIN domain nuclease of toxin-antitoxin system
MAIKVKIGKLQLPGPFDTVIEAERRRQKIKLLPVSIAHIKRLSSFPSKAGHNDPSDHIMICQALVEKMTLIISADENFPAYREMGLQLLSN